MGPIGKFQNFFPLDYPCTLKLGLFYIKNVSRGCGCFGLTFSPLLLPMLLYKEFIKLYILLRKIFKIENFSVLLKEISLKIFRGNILGATNEIFIFKL